MTCEEYRRCGVTKTLKILGSKWTMQILYILISDGTKRFGELKNFLPEISTKTLSQRLQELEEEHFIKRKVFHEIPLHVEYSATQKALSLDQVFGKMEQWGEQTL
jgi:DNA-binding HxlR family transcriptional regulator